MEKRLTLTIFVHLAQLPNQSPCTAELTYTDNISAHGACVISNRAWELGETVEVTDLERELALRGKVVHCQRRTEDHYAIGLNFQDRTRWSEFCNASGCTDRQVVADIRYSLAGEAG